MNKILLSVAIATATFFTTKSQNVNIPDANFKNYLLGNSAINTNNDGEIQVSEAQAYTGAIYAANLSMNTPIADLTGIEAFININFLDVRYNQLTSLNLSNNTALWHLACNDNLLTSIDVSNSTVLEYLYCANNQLTGLNINNNTSLRDLGCANNQITSLNVSNNTALENLYCNNNQLTSLSLSNNTALILLDCSYNQIPNLNISTNTSLLKLTCNNNQLTSLNVANGKNATINSSNFQRFWVFNNPNLSCIQVDNVQHCLSHWANGTTANGDVFVYDNGVNFSLNCTSTGISEFDENISVYVYPNPVNTTLNISTKNISTTLNIKIVNLLGETVISAILNNQDSNIDVSNLTNGVYFIHSSNGGAVKFIKE